VLRRSAIQTLLVMMALSIVAMFSLSSPASATPKAAANAQPAVMMTAYVTSKPPTNDCLGMASLLLGGLAVKAGAAAWAIGEGAVAENLNSVLSYVGGITGSYSCLSYLVPAYIDSICQQSHGSLFNYHTLWARALVFLATRGHKSLC
jgi:hypothetical protein